MNGNLQTRTDARNAITSYQQYDGLNRLLLKTYDLTHVFAGQTVAVTPGVQYTYDLDLREAGDTVANFPVGRLSQVTVGQSATLTHSTQTMTHYDGLGRVTASRQDVGDGPGTAYRFLYTHNHQGLESMVYPSQRKIQYVYDAVGRVQTVQNLSGVNLPAYASNIQYAPHGAIQQMTLGNQVVEQRQFNVRLQGCAIRVGSSAVALSGCPASVSGMPAGLLNLVYDYGTSNNNGNLHSQQIGVSDPGQSLSWSQTYGYDLLNRVTTAAEAELSAVPALPGGVTAGNWNVTNAYDGYGNRWETASYGLGAAVPTAGTQFNVAKNQLALQQNGTAMPGDAYDLAGNLRDHPAIGQMVYDAENRLVQFTAGGNVSTYDYDGEGRRVHKTVTGASASTTTYVYDAAGRLAGEATTGVTQDTGTTYLSADHLGSTRLVTGSSGSVAHRYDFQPNGEDLSSLGMGNRNLVGSYLAAAGPTMRFTGKERDAETGLDYFGARYFSGAQGRFTSPDLKSAGADVSNPQSWNGYSYALNNPLAYTDPNGMWPFYVHNRINAAVFGGVLSPHQFAYVGGVNWRADYGKGAQEPSQSYTHSMCAPGDGAGACSFKITNFIGIRLNQANQLSGGGREITDDALEAFGQALHAMEDMGSPAHVTDEGNPIPWGNGLREGAAHVWAERDASVNWFRLGQSIRLGISAFSQAFPYLSKKQGNPDAWARRAIESYVGSYFAVPDKNADHGAEDAARQCALGNPAACGM